MYIRSTGLGRTLLRAKIAKIEATDIIPATLEKSLGANEPTRLLMTMEISEPVHWTVRAFMEPPDLRHLIRMALTNPTFLFNALRFFFSKSEKSRKNG